MALHHRFGPDERLDLRVKSVAHQLELTIGWNERNGPVIFKTRESHALVKFDIFHLDRLSARRASHGFEHDLVVEPQT